MSFSLSVRLLIETPQVTGSPALFRLAHEGDRVGAGDHGGVVAGAGEADETQVALEEHGLGFARDAGEPEPRGGLALVHDAVADEVANPRGAA